jgi:hypothetical protein
VLASTLDAAAQQIHERQRRAIEHFALALACAAAALPLWLVRPELAVAVAIGAVVQLALSLYAIAVRRSQIARLALDRDAYAIPEVARYGERLAAPRQRQILADGIRTTIRDAFHPNSLCLGERVAAYARELEGIARLLRAPGVRVHPASVVWCRRLLTEAADSPLYNASLPKEDLGFVLHCIRAGFEQAES